MEAVYTLLERLFDIVLGLSVAGTCAFIVILLCILIEKYDKKQRFVNFINKYILGD